MESSRVINCHYNYAVNNSCRTDQFCYAEWRLANFDQLVTESRFSDSVDISQIELDKAFNCYNGRPDPLIFETICEQSATITSHIIRRCCRDADYCNNRSSLLPNEELARQQFHKILTANLAHSSSAVAAFDIVGKYSDLPLIVQVGIVFISLSILCFAALAVNQFGGHRGHAHGFSSDEESSDVISESSSPGIEQSWRQSSAGAGHPAPKRPRAGSTNSAPGYPVRHELTVKKVINSLLINVGIRRDRRSSSVPVEPSPNASESRFVRHPNDDATAGALFGGEGPNGGAAASATREPLLDKSNYMSACQKMSVHHPQPHVEEAQGTSTLQVTLGTGLDEKDEETSSGSGKGQPYLTHRSISNDIQLRQVIGRGYYGVVWRGNYKGQPVAVKVFASKAESSWERETEIYQTTMLRHKHILGLIASDKTGDRASDGCWLVTDYYPMGSLFDFLMKNSITMYDAIRMGFSIANGLSHLHVEIFGTRAKPAIAHRDMKSKNILVKKDGTCCIADLGMAVRYNSSTGIVDLPTVSRMGTRRYLAPEILEDKLNMLDFEAVKATDMYAFGLVLWEILRRACLVSDEQTDFRERVQMEALDPVTLGSRYPRDDDGLRGRAETSSHPEPQPGRSEPGPAAAPRAGPSHQSSAQRQDIPSPAPGGQPTSQQEGRPWQRLETFEELCRIARDVDPFRVPYYTDVSSDPHGPEMYEVVCVKKIRPRLSARWVRFSSMRDYAQIMTECWYEKPQARLSALRVRKSLADLAIKYFNKNILHD